MWVNEGSSPSHEGPVGAKNLSPLSSSAIPQRNKRQRGRKIFRPYGWFGIVVESRIPRLEKKRRGPGIISPARAV